MDRIVRQTISEGIRFTSIRDARFKQSLLSVNFLLPLQRETAAVNALLPMVLRRGCEDYPDMTALNSRLKELYGARLDGGVIKRGEAQIVSFYCEMLDNRYALEGEDMLTECASLLQSVIFRPVLKNGVFDENEVAIERHNLSDLIDAQLNDKRAYASRRLKEEMCRDEAFGISELGSREEAAAVTPQVLTDAWKRMLASAQVEIFLISEGAGEGCERLFTQTFRALSRTQTAVCETQVIRHAGKVKTVEEHLPVSQAKLVMGFRAGIATPDADVPAMQLACNILGGSPNSKLFANVREALSLCYYCFSRFERQKGLLLIESGIESANYQKAREAILAQLADVQAGDFTDDEMKAAVMSLQNSYMEISDSLAELSAWYLGQAVAGTMHAPSEAAQEVAALSREEVVVAARKIEPDTFYLLAGEKGEEV
ncbi:MAG: insulinase family protein [Clostridia bacterium]|nr:insulinase family protein [Clostridia bacterium]